MDYVKESFRRAKEDISFLNQEIQSIKGYLSETRGQMKEICEILFKLYERVSSLEENQKELSQRSIPPQNLQNPTTSTHLSTHNEPFKGLNPQILPLSTGNEGVPTDRQTDRQTDQQTHYEPKIQENSVDNAVKILDSLDSLKKEIRLKFKRLTDQEWLIFSTIYQIDEQQGYSDYKVLAEKLKLTESSIRDYVGRLIKKGIPIEKTKMNNKTIHLSISQNLKKIASLPTIIQLRGI